VTLDGSGYVGQLIHLAFKVTGAGARPSRAAASWG